MLNPTVERERAENVDWKWIWKTHTPPKAKHLIWRICKGCLPTRIQLKESIRAWQAAGLVSIISPRIQRFNTPQECLIDICSNTDMEPNKRTRTAAREQGNMLMERMEHSAECQEQQQKSQLAS
ncbi:unnamed protein product [Trifolium pratense]|uniref:Uncharacterized protein n=1 Tax=Trifolium pratense TaxID=57577 RepID=A0ACB0K177_TRIPR|nr:unnamed protein product [Trifolium pratense]